MYQKKKRIQIKNSSASQLTHGVNKGPTPLIIDQSSEMHPIPRPVYPLPSFLKTLLDGLIQQRNASEVKMGMNILGSHWYKNTAKNAYQNSCILVNHRVKTLCSCRVLYKDTFTNVEGQIITDGLIT